MRHDLISTVRYIYINSNLNPLTKLFSSKGSTKFEDILSWNISQMIRNTVTISTGIVISYMTKQGIHLEIDESQWNLRQQHEFPNGGKANVEQILESEERKKSKRARLRVTVRDLIRKFNHLTEVI